MSILKTVLFFSCMVQIPTLRIPGLYIGSIKFFWSSSDNGTVSKFPPILELLVQRIQGQYSNYIHEDLSRPPTWNKPVYTLSPTDQQYFYGTTPNPIPITTTTDQYEYEELEETTGKFFEVISSEDAKDCMKKVKVGNCLCNLSARVPLEIMSDPAWYEANSSCI